MALLIDLAQGDSLNIDSGRIKIRLEEKKGNKSRLSIEADRSIKIEKTQTIRNHHTIMDGLKKQ